MIEEVDIRQEDIVFLGQERVFEVDGIKRKPIVAAFGRNSPVGKFAESIWSGIAQQKNTDEKENLKKDFLNSIAEISRLQESDLKKFNVAVAKLGLIAAGFLDKAWIKNLDFNTSEIYADFYGCISSCAIDDLIKYQSIIFQGKFRKNSYESASRLTLFLNKNIKDEEQNRLFEESLNFIIDNNEEDAKKYYQHAAKLTLIAAGLWNESVPGNESKTFSAIVGETQEFNAAFCEFVSALSTNTLTAKWIKDFLGGMINFPDDKIKEALKNSKIEMPPGYFSIPYRVYLRKNANGKQYWTKAKNKNEATDIFYIAIDKTSQGKLGEGSYGNVYKGYLLDQGGNVVASKPYAVKLTKFGKNIQIKELKEEADINRIVGGLPFTLEPFEFTDDHFVLPMEFVSGKILKTPSTNNLNDPESRKKIDNIKNKFKELTFAERARLIREIAVAVTDLHRRGVIHADIKWENILIDIRVDKNQQKVFDVTFVDFGLSIKTGNSYDPTKKIIADNYGGTRRYVAPEVANGRFYYSGSDIYSLTPIFASIFGAKNPFKNKNSLEERVLREFNAEDIIKLKKLLKGKYFEDITNKIKLENDKYKEIYFTSEEYVRISKKLNQIFENEKNNAIMAETLLSKFSKFDKENNATICGSIYDFDGIFEDLKNNITPEYQYIFSYIENFFYTMQNQNTDVRISDEKLLIFTKYLDEFARLTDNKITEDERKKYKNRIESNAAKIILLAHGIFDNNMKNNVGEIDIELEDHPTLCEQIISIFESANEVFVKASLDDKNPILEKAKQEIKSEFDETRKNIEDVRKTIEIFQKYNLWEENIDDKLRFKDFKFEKNLEFCKLIANKYSVDFLNADPNDFDKKN